MASTQFESIDARQCFPCWDEPRRKATFKVTLTVPRHMSALSNMPIACHRDNGPEAGTVTTAFMISPRMSTYLLAFVVGEFAQVAALTKNGVLVAVYTPPLKPELGEFALGCAVAALDRYDEQFGHPYPLPKLDSESTAVTAMLALLCLLSVTVVQP
jgi:puromycin-sensitive aminopeptidase